MPILAYRDALNQAMLEEMERDDNVYLMGEEVADTTAPIKSARVSGKNSARAALSTHRFLRAVSQALGLALPWSGCVRSLSS